MVKFEIDLNTDSAAQMSAAALFFKTLAESASGELPAQPVAVSASPDEVRRPYADQPDRTPAMQGSTNGTINAAPESASDEAPESASDEAPESASDEAAEAAEIEAQAAEEEAKKEAKRKRDRERRATKKREAEEAEAAKQNEDQTIAETDAEATKDEEETPDEPAEVTYNNIRSAISQRAKEHKDELKALVATYGVKLAKDVPSEKWGEFLTAINEIGA